MGFPSLPPDGALPSMNRCKGVLVDFIF
jgi:hypothetical protein